MDFDMREESSSSDCCSIESTENANEQSIWDECLINAPIDIPHKKFRASSPIFNSQPEFVSFGTGKRILARSWNGTDRRDDYITYDPVHNCKGSGIVPFTIHNGKIYFLMQRSENPIKKKDAGWNDFGGKKDEGDGENTIPTACREFSEETSCLFYLHEIINTVKNETEIADLKAQYDRIISYNSNHDDSISDMLPNLIKESKQYYENKLNKKSNLMYISSKEIYISFFLHIPYIECEKIPIAEDLHVFYEERYTRECKWFSYDELMELDDRDFHKRLQITKIKKRIINYFEKGLFFNYH